MEGDKRTVSTTGDGEYSSRNAFVHTFEVLHSLRQDEELCDIKLETDDGTTVHGHRVVLAAASPYFRAMFTNFGESNKDLVRIHELDSGAFKLLVDFIYTAKIKVTEANAQVLLNAANLLQLNDVKYACCDFLQNRMCPMNCFGIKALADLHDCTELSSISQSYIRQHFSEVVLADEFLSLSFEQVVKLISCDDLTVPSEEKVFESVIRWVNHNSDFREDVLPKLMEHVRLPLTSTEYLQRVVEESLVKRSPECKDYLIEALLFQQLKLKQAACSMPKSKRTKPRRYAAKVILVVGGSDELTGCSEFYDLVTDLWHHTPAISTRSGAAFAVLNDRWVFSMGGQSNTVEMIDLTLPSPSWVVQTACLLPPRTGHGVAVLNNCIYAVGGCGNGFLNSTEVFDCSTKKWQMISYMSDYRKFPGVAVLDNLLYAVGGLSHNRAHKSVECYHPSTNTWTRIASMHIGRSGAGVGALDGVLYAVGGKNSYGETVKSVEAYRPSTGVWTPVTDMQQNRTNAGVVVSDGLLYVVGGEHNGVKLNSVEIYNPNIDSWSMLTASMSYGRSRPGVFVVDNPGF